NVIVFGETGVGKSSVVNLIAGKEVAKVSSSVDGCTMSSTPYPVVLSDRKICIFDTVGLEEPQMGVNGYLAAIEKAYRLIQSLGKAGGVHLLLFCMRGGRITATAQSNYRLFCEFLCNKQVPIALVFTGLEKEERMEDWWERNAKIVESYGIRGVSHACITAVRDNTSGQDYKYQESARMVRELLTKYAREDNAFLLESQIWIAVFGRKLMGLITKKRNPKQKDIVKVLTKRCKFDPETANKIAETITQGEEALRAGADGQAVATGEEVQQEEGGGRAA
ncbi:P-loop containing nucleoside triphosphate hydrolase protein, partial [Melanogaster broomeanus]